jgi:hypothetical protein
MVFSRLRHKTVNPVAIALDGQFFVMAATQAMLPCLAQFLRHIRAAVFQKYLGTARCLLFLLSSRCVMAVRDAA